MSRSASTPTLHPRVQHLAAAVDRAVGVVARHWLLVLLAYGIVAIGLAVAAPLLRAAGNEQFARPLYAVFSLICHQRADRSFHIHGEQMAFCVRDFAIFAGAVAVALGYALWRRYRLPQHVDMRFMLLCMLPLTLDGLTQLAGLRESTWELRLTTGLLFSVGIGWFLLPRLEDGFRSLAADAVNRSTVSEPPKVGRP
jgi:uncharacterized membrane protein